MRIFNFDRYFSFDKARLFYKVNVLRTVVIDTGYGTSDNDPPKPL